jgi:hypothetical protein
LQSRLKALESSTTMDVEIKLSPEIAESLKRIADNLEESVKMQREAREEQKKFVAQVSAANTKR